jgi:hypothetical protein
MAGNIEPIKRPQFSAIIPTPSVPRGLEPYIQQREPALVLNIGIQIPPRYLIDVIKQLVSNGMMSKDVAIKYLEKLIEYAEDYLRELRE